MFKEYVIEFLFNGKKYRLEKYVVLLLFWFVAFILSSFSQVSLPVLFAPVLMFLMILSLIRILWYNKKKNVKTGVVDWIGMTLCLIVLIVAIFFSYKEHKLESAVYDVIEQKVGNANFRIESVNEMENEETYIVVVYTIEGDSSKYMEWYYWSGRELIHHNPH